METIRGFWSIFAWYYHIDSVDLFPAHQWRKSCLPSRTKHDLVDLDLVAVYVPETSLRWSELSDQYHVLSWFLPSYHLKYKRKKIICCWINTALYLKPAVLLVCHHYLQSSPCSPSVKHFLTSVVRKESTLLLCKRTAGFRLESAIYCQAATTHTLPSEQHPFNSHMKTQKKRAEEQSI